MFIHLDISLGLIENGIMDKLTSKARIVRNVRQLWHYVFNSDVHLEDEKKARKKRRAVFIEIEMPEPNRTPFPSAKEVAANAIRGKGGEFEIVAAKSYVDRLDGLRLQMAYWVPKKGRVKKNGTPTLQKGTTMPLQDCYFNLPPWYAQFLAMLLDKDTSLFPWVQEVVLAAAKAAMAVVEERSGYEGVGIALHPDSCGSFGFHLQYLTAKDGKLLGRSASGKPGKPALRLANDGNLALYRFDQVDPVPGGWKKIVAERDYDDVAMEGPMVAALRVAIIAKLGPEALVPLDNLARIYVRDWKASASSGLDKVELAELQELAGNLRKENAMLRDRLGKSENRLLAMEKAVSEDSLPPEF